MRSRSLSRALLGIWVSTAAWLGCNAILGIEGAEFVGSDASISPDVAAGDDATPPDGAALDGDPPGTPDAGPCVDVDRNPNHCGACGHSCLGGTCASGRCSAVVLSSELGSPTEVATDGVHVYWTNLGLGDIRRARVDGGAVETVFDGPPGTRLGAIATLGSDLYFSIEDADGGVFRCPLAGCGPSPVSVLAPLDTPTHLRITDAGAGAARVVVAENVFNGRVMSVDVASLDASTRAASEGFPSFVAGAGNDVFWDALLPGPGNIRVARSGQPAATFRSSVVARELQVVGDELFYAVLGNGVFASPTDGGPSRRLSPSAQVFRIAVDANDVYLNDTVRTGSSGRILRCARQGCDDGGAVVLAAGQAIPNAVALDDLQVYWVNQGESDAGGSVMRIAK